MLEVYLLLGGCTALAFCVEWLTDTDGLENQTNSLGNVLFFLLLATLVLFGGLRTWMNDTATYAKNYLQLPSTLDGLRQTDWRLGSNPVFFIGQVLLRTFVSKSSQAFLFLTTILITVFLVRFLWKYGDGFGFTLYLYLAFTVYAGTLALMKQSIAMSIAVWGIPDAAEGRWGRYCLRILFASLIHPYVLLWLIAPLFANRSIWGKLDFLVLGAGLAAGFAFWAVLKILISLAGGIGDIYDDSDLFGGGVNILRTLFYCIVPVLSYLFRDTLREKWNPVMTLCVHLSVAAMGASIFSIFGAAILMGRVAQYLDIPIVLSLPWVLHRGFQNRPYIGLAVSWGLAGAFLVFYSAYYYKYFTAWHTPLLGSVYNRTTLWAMLKGW